MDSDVIRQKRLFIQSPAGQVFSASGCRGEACLGGKQTVNKSGNVRIRTPTTRYPSLSLTIRFL